MTSTQLIVLALLVGAFVSGWVARGAGAAPPARAEPDAREPVAQTTEADDARLLHDAAAGLEAAIDAWIDRQDPRTPLDRFETTRARVREAASARPSAALDDAADALTEAADVFSDFEAGRSMSAHASRRLTAVEEALSRSGALAERA